MSVSVKLKVRPKLGLECSEKKDQLASLSTIDRDYFAEITLMVFCLIALEVVQMFYSILHRQSP